MGQAEASQSVSKSQLELVRQQIARAAATVLAILKGESETTRTQRDALTAFAVRVASAALLYLSQIVLARWMGGFDYGVYVFVWTWVLVLGGLSHLGLNLVVIRMIPEYREMGQSAHLRGLLRGTRIAAFALGTVVALLGAGGLWILSPYMQSHYVLRPLLLLVAMAAANLAGLPMQATTAAGAAILATWVTALVQTLLINRRISETMEQGPHTYDFGFWLKTSAPLLLIVAADLMLQNTDVLVISQFLSPMEVGIYFAAAKTMALIMFVHYAVGSAVANRFAALNARGDREGLKAFVRDAVNWTFWPSLLCAAIILALGKPLLWLFGPQFTTGYPVMFVLVIGFLFRSAMGPAEFLLNMLGEQTLCATVLGFTALLNIALNYALVPHFGMLGAASATAVSLMTASLMNYVVVRRRLDIEIGIWNNVGKK